MSIERIEELGAVLLEETKDYTASSFLAEESQLEGLIETLRQNPTEDNIAQAFELKYKDQYKYLRGRGCWFEWDGARWKEDRLGAVSNSIRLLSRKLNTEGKFMPARDSFHRGVENQLKSDPSFAADAETFDQDNYLLNCPDATYDLRSY